MQITAMSHEQVPLRNHHREALHDGSLSLAERKLSEEGIKKIK